MVLVGQQNLLRIKAEKKGAVKMGPVAAKFTSIILSRYTTIDKLPTEVESNRRREGDKKWV